MALPFSYPFKTRVVEVATTSTGTVVISVPVPARGYLLGANLSVGMIGAQSSCTVDFIQVASAYSTGAIVGSTIAGMGTTALGASAVTSTTGSAFFFTPAATTYVSAGDVLTLSSTGCVGPGVQWIIREF